MSRCFVTRELPGGALDRLRAEHQVDVWPETLPPPRQELVERAHDAHGLLCMLTDSIDAELIAACPELTAIANYAVGVDNVDLAAAAARGIAVGNTPGVLTEATADLTLALMLGALRRLSEAEAKVREGKWRTWEPAALLGRDLHGASVLLVGGGGRIGRAVGRRLEGFGARVVTAGRDDPISELLPAADVVSLHCPLTPDTRGLIGAAELSVMKPAAVLVNTARGPIVDTHALERALHAAEIAAAALDVTDPEPLPVGHPLLSAPGALVVPHVGSATHAAREAMAELAVDNLLAALADRPMPHEVETDPLVEG